MFFEKFDKLQILKQIRFLKNPNTLKYPTPAPQNENIKTLKIPFKKHQIGTGISSLQGVLRNPLNNMVPILFKMSLNDILNLKILEF